MKNEDQHWQRLLDAMKAGEASRAKKEDISPPPGFVTRISARVATARRDETLKLWRRWSLYGVAGSTCLFLIAVAYTALTRDTSPLLPLPSIDLPSNF